MNPITTVSDFIASPFDWNKDGQISLLELFAGVGIVIVFVLIWRRLLAAYTEL